MLPNSQAALEDEAAGLRAGLKASLAELRQRSSPSHVLGVAREAAVEKARVVLGEGLDYVKEHGPAVAVAGGGALLAFDLGRRSVSSSSASADAADASEHREIPDPDRPGGVRQKAAALGEKVTIWSEALGATALGSVLATAIPVTSPERELLGDFPSNAKHELEKFAQEHKTGIKQAVAQAFGIASAAAWFLALLAIAADKLQGREAQAPKPGNHSSKNSLAEY
jgi:hypothetical protein